MTLLCSSLRLEVAQHPIAESLLRHGNSSIHQWGPNALQNRTASCSSPGFHHSTPLRRCAVPAAERSAANVLTHNLDLWTSSCSSEGAQSHPGIHCKEETLWPRLQIQSRAVARLRTSATRIASGQETEEDNAGNGAAATTPPAEGSSSRGEGGKIKVSGQLSKWARARKIRSGRLTTMQKKNASIATVVEEVAEEEPTESRQELVDREAAREDSDEGLEGGEDFGLTTSLEGYEKCVFMISDGTGWTADHSVHAALGQFEHCMVDRRCSVNTHLFSDVSSHPEPKMFFARVLSYSLHRD